MASLSLPTKSQPPTQKPQEEEEEESVDPMAHDSLFRRRSPDLYHQVLLKNSTPLPTPPSRSFPSILPFLLLLFFTIWFTSILFSSSFHVCFSSRKLDLYCISGGTGPHPTTTTTNTTDPETAKAVEIVEKQVQLIRSWAHTNRTSTSSCNGKGIFIYDLPPKFNKHLLSHCHNLLPWADLCDYFSNDGMGQPIPTLGPGWYRTHQYSLELIFHSKISNHPCRLTDPQNATLFYVPFYGGLDVLRWHFKNVSTDVKDALGGELVAWLEKQDTWRRRGGRDHVFVLGKISWDFRRKEGGKWGSNFLSLDGMRAPYKFLIERQPWEEREVGVPHPTNFHPHSDGEVEEWQKRIAGKERGRLVSFAGAARPAAAAGSIRAGLIANCVANEGTCRFLDCGSGSCANPEDVITAFTESEFCLQPPGDSPTRKSVFDSLVAGCIPVLFDAFTAYYQYPWHLPEDHRRYSVFIDQQELREGKVVDVVGRLRSVPVEERKEMRRYIVYELMPGLIYGDPTSEFVGFRDAFGIVMDNVMELVTRSDG